MSDQRDAMPSAASKVAATPAGAEPAAAASNVPPTPAGAEPAAADVAAEAVAAASNVPPTPAGAEPAAADVAAEAVARASNVAATPAGAEPVAADAAAETVSATSAPATSTSASADATVAPDPRIVHTTAEIAALIPHRWPFLLVDRIVEYDPEAGRIVGQKAVTATEWFFHGHFPELPIMPGVLQVEALAQTMAVYVAKQPGFGDRIGLFAGIEDCRFKRIVSPGDTLRLEVTMEKLGRRFGKGRGVASVDGEVACEALLSFIIPPEGALR